MIEDTFWFLFLDKVNPEINYLEGGNVNDDQCSVSWTEQNWSGRKGAGCGVGLNGCG